MEKGKIIGFGILGVALIVFAVALIRLDGNSKKGYNIRCDYSTHAEGQPKPGYCHVKGALEN